MRGVECEGRQADGDVLGTLGFRCAVSHPFTAPDDNRLSSANIDDCIVGFDPEQTGEDHRVFIELRRLTRLDPTTWTSHPGDAQAGVSAIHPADELINQFGLGTGSFDPRRLLDQRRHRPLSPVHETICFTYVQEPIY